MLTKLLSIYRKNAYISLPLYRISRPAAFGKTLHFLRESEGWSEKEIQQWQLKRIIDIVEYAYAHVPYYHDLYFKAGFRPGEIGSINDFSKLPTIRKRDIKNNLHAFLSDEADLLPKVSSCTGGSTDKPMQFWLDASMNPRENAFYEYYWRKFGFGYGEKCIVLRGNAVPNCGKPIGYTYDRLLNLKVFDSSDASNPEKTAFYDKEIRSFNAKAIRAYPSVLYILAKNYEVNRLAAPCIPFIFLSSENTYESQLDVIRRVFQPNNLVYGYGHSEFVSLALKYRDRNELGFFPQYGYTELLEEQHDYASVTTDTTAQEITGTGWSRVMPFIRYRTEDYAVASDYKSNDFMRNCLSVNHIEGRKQESIVTTDGTRIPLVIIAGAHLPSLCLIGDMQYVQTHQGELTVLVTSIHPGEMLTQETLQKIQKDVATSINNRCAVTVVQVNEIKKAHNGKRILLLKELPNLK